MCEQHQHSLRCNPLRRRSFLKVVGSATAVGICGGGLVSEAAYADALTKAQRDEMSPTEIIDVIKKGNERFRSGVRQNRNYLNEQKASASGQYPAAALLSCIDSRAPAEVIMDLGLGDIFNCRVAGNVANTDILGSMEFACRLAGAKVVLVMGHTELDGKDLRRVPIEQRKQALVGLLHRERDGLVLNVHYDCDGATVFKHACALGCEGIVSKRLGSPYRSGRSPHWVKVKNPNAPAVKREAEEDWGSPNWIRSKITRREPS
jgi:hypothetical protein